MVDGLARVGRARAPGPWAWCACSAGRAWEADWARPCALPLQRLQAHIAAVLEMPSRTVARIPGAWGVSSGLGAGQPARGPGRAYRKTRARATACSSSWASSRGSQCDGRGGRIPGQGAQQWRSGQAGLLGRGADLTALEVKKKLWDRAWNLNAAVNSERFSVGKAIRNP